MSEFFKCHNCRHDLDMGAEGINCPICDSLLCMRCQDEDCPICGADLDIGKEPE